LQLTNLRFNKKYLHILRNSLRIGEVSKVFNYYNLYSENLSGDVTDWTAAFEEGVTQEVVSQQQAIDFEEVHKVYYYC
jgi:hypothetical protein